MVRKLNYTLSFCLLFLINIPSANAGDTITIIGVGDIMPGTDYPSSKYLPPNNDCKPLFRNVSEILNSVNITCGNLEGSMAGQTGKAKYCKNPDQCFVFRIPEAYINCLVETGFDFLSIANNHSNDFGWAGRQNTIKVLKQANIGFAGLPAYETSIKRIDSLVVGFCAFSPHTGTCSIKDLTYVVNLIKNLDDTCDIIIASFHGGAEGAKYQHVPKTDEFFLGNYRGNVYAFAHTAIDAGADIVFGHGPHVTRAIELYKNKFIAYSLGNFCTYARFNLNGPNGIAPIIKININTQGDFINGSIIPIIQQGKGPVPDPDKKVITLLQQLTTSDFPDTQLIIKNNGLIFPK